MHDALPVLRAARALGLRTRDGAEVPVEAVEIEGERLFGNAPRFRVSAGLELSGAAGAARRVGLDSPLVARLERVEREGDEIVPIGVLAGHQASARVALILSIPRRIRPLTVPRGSLSISAISEWLKPPK